MGLLPRIDHRKIERRTVAPGFHARIIHTEKMTHALWQVDPHAHLPEHSHPHEQVVHVLSGRFELTVSGVPHLLEPGVVFVIPPNAPHAGRALSACEILDVFAPVRDDL